ncbi:Cof-type HAD-IIB family hydrolase [Sporolactobacillus vineae]|uniref:Cof-type HAD-IIB family hydrolase n=1 Tax=Sporolactobacillus vineae TaxID=444463 RepID=UPI000289DC3E|nr:Cof-type HAD-IIB family hydrolase [Sporolactobacillus vineae]
MIKLIAMDLDGTLLNSKRTISWDNLKALRFARSKGVTLVIATGRAFFDVRHLMQEIDIQTHVIGTNGATIHTIEGQLIGADVLDRTAALQAVSELAAQHYYIGVYTDKNIYVPREGTNWLYQELDRLHIHEDRSVGFQGATRDDFYRFFDDPQEIEKEGRDIFKIIICSYDDAKLLKARRFYEEKHRYNIVSSGIGNFEIMGPNVSKGNALYHLASFLDIPLEDVMAIGDNYNDLSMFAVSGISVAMGNADEVIKKKCTRVTLDCSDDGVASAIYEELKRK